MIQQEQVWLFWAQLAQGFGSMLSVLVALYVAMLLHNYSRRRDRLEFMRQRWHEQQQINLALTSDMELLKIAEFITYGRELRDTPKLSKKFYYLFLIINQIHHHYLSYQFGIYSRKEFRRYSLPTVSLIVREAPTIMYLVAERGYSVEFEREMLLLLKDATPPAQPAFADVDDEPASVLATVS
jgi:hypothetical protein